MPDLLTPQNMTLATPYLAVAAIVLVVAVLIILLRGLNAREDSAQQTAELSESIDRIAMQQAELAGRLRQLGEVQAASQNMVGERLQAQERAIGRNLEQYLENLSRRVGEGLGKQTETTQKNLGTLQERLAVIDAAQKNIADLSTQMVGLREILSNKQARGAFGEIQLNDLIAAALPASTYKLQATLSNNTRVDCLLTLPNPPGNICIDAKFPLESFAALQNAAEDPQARQRAARAFSSDVLRHVKAIAEKYIIPGETAESALMFLPSEAIYAALHAEFRNVVEESYRLRVWITSPTSVMATLTTVRAVLKDVHIREQAGVIQKEMNHLMDDVARLDTRITNLQRHFEQATEDVRQARITTDKIARRGETIRDLELGEVVGQSEVKKQLD